MISLISIFVFTVAVFKCSAETIDVNYSEFSIPAEKDKSFYMCKITKIPAQPKALNLIKTTVKTSEANKPMLLDIVVYRCAGDLDSSLVDRQFPCTDKLTGDLAEVDEKCFDETVAIFNIGNPAEMNVAKHSGVPFVEPNVEQYLLTASEYVNNGPEDVNDSSSFHMELAEADGKMNDGFLALGPSISPNYFIIPPKQSKFTISSICTSNCLKYFPTDGIDIYSGSFFTYPTENQLVKYSQEKSDSNNKCDSDFEEFLECGTACEPTCLIKDPQICTLQCVQGCFCKEGYIRSGLPGLNKNGKCVSKPTCNDVTVEVRLRLIRNGVELEPIFEDKAFNPLAQKYMELTVPRKVLPTDVLITECTYRTEDRDEPRFGGFDVTDQWCVIQLFYYPKLSDDILTCTSAPKPESVYAKTMGVEVVGDYNPFNRSEVMVKRPGDLDSNAKPLWEMAKDVKWTTEMVNSLLENQKKGEHFEFCDFPTVDEEKMREVSTHEFSGVHFPN